MASMKEADCLCNSPPMRLSPISDDEMDVAYSDSMESICMLIQTDNSSSREGETSDG